MGSPQHHLCRRVTLRLAVASVYHARQAVRLQPDGCVLLDYIAEERVAQVTTPPAWAARAVCRVPVSLRVIVAPTLNPSRAAAQAFGKPLTGRRSGALSALREGTRHTARAQSQPLNKRAKPQCSI